MTMMKRQLLKTPTPEEATKEENPFNFVAKPRWEHLISTNSTLLDLAITGGRLEYGGIPTGILAELAGESGAGKTALLTEISAKAQAIGGSVRFADPEARLDKEYAQITGVELCEEDYFRPKTVTDLFDDLDSWQTDPDIPNVYAADSLTALSTEMEMEDGDKMGMRKAKELSAELRKRCLVFGDRNILMLATNQLRGGEGGKKTTPGGEAVKFYSSLRLWIMPSYPSSKIVSKKKIHGVDQDKVIGVRTTVTCKKNSLDDPFREADIFIVFGYGIDDIRGNLTYIKENRKLKDYELGGVRIASSIGKAIEIVERDNLEQQLKKETADLWREIQEAFRTTRKKRVL